MYHISISFVAFYFNICWVTALMCVWPYSLSSNPFYFPIASWSWENTRFFLPTQLPYYTPKPDNTHNVSMNLLQTCYYQALNHSVCSPFFPPPCSPFSSLLSLPLSERLSVFPRPSLTVHSSRPNPSLLSRSQREALDSPTKPPGEKSLCTAIFPFCSSGAGASV